MNSMEAHGDVSTGRLPVVVGSMRAIWNGRLEVESSQSRGSFGVTVGGRTDDDPGIFALLSAF